MSQHQPAEPQKTQPRDDYDVQLILLQLVNIARLVQLGPSDVHLQKYIEHASRADTIAPIVDPTLWMRGHKKNDCFLKIARALATFRASLPTLQETLEADRVANVLASEDEE